MIMIYSNFGWVKPCFSAIRLSNKPKTSNSIYISFKFGCNMDKKRESEISLSQQDLMEENLLNAISEF